MFWNIVKGQEHKVNGKWRLNYKENISAIFGYFSQPRYGMLGFNTSDLAVSTRTIKEKEVRGRVVTLNQ